MRSFEDPVIRSALLTIAERSMGIEISQDFIDDDRWPEIKVRVESLVHAFTHRIRLEARMAAEKPMRGDFSFPKNWKEAIKERWFPKWLKRRYPVKYTNIVIQLQAIYPDLQIPEHMSRRYFNVTVLDRKEVIDNNDYS